MVQVEQHIVNKSNSSKNDWQVIDHLAFLSKNLYNTCLWTIKNHFEATGKWMRYNEMYRKFYTEQTPAFIALPAASAQQIMMVMDKNMKSYFALLKMYRKNKKLLTGCPQFPKYKDSIKGRNIIVFTSQQMRLQKDGIINFPKKSDLRPLKTKIPVGSLKQVRIIPQSSCYVIEVVYEKEAIQAFPSNDSWLSIDLGINNLMTCFDTVSSKPTIINGKPLKSINQFYNKKHAKLQSRLQKQYPKRRKSKKLTKLTTKRNRKIKDYLHKSSRFVVNYCLESGISNIVVGYNAEWKQNVQLGSKNNQNFVQIPFLTLINQLEYKAALLGITVVRNEESYTSKCSAMDLEPVEKHDTYCGERVKRGMFKSSTGQSINADLNGAINILRKVAGDKEPVMTVVKQWVQTQSSIGQVVWPFHTCMNK